MPSTSVHLPDALVERLDKLAKESGRSRNRLIIEACEAYVAAAREEWPVGFFSRLAPSDERALRSSLEDWLEALDSTRHNRAVEPF